MHHLFYKCIQDYPRELQYFDIQKEQWLKICLKRDDTICLNDCKLINELSDITSHLCVKYCKLNLFCIPELMTSDKKCNGQYKYYMTYENKTKIRVNKCDDFPYVLDENNFEYFIFTKFEFTSI